VRAPRALLLKSLTLCVHISKQAYNVSLQPTGAPLKLASLASYKLRPQLSWGARQVRRPSRGESHGSRVGYRRRRIECFLCLLYRTPAGRHRLPPTYPPGRSWSVRGRRGLSRVSDRVRMGRPSGVARVGASIRPTCLTIAEAAKVSLSMLAPPGTMMQALQPSSRR
jgi:hypothetical protein